MLKLITSYEEREKADIKLFTTTQVSSLGLFAEQGFIFRDSAESIRSSEILEKDKDSLSKRNTHKEEEIILEISKSEENQKVQVFFIYIYR